MSEVRKSSESVMSLLCSKTVRRLFRVKLLIVTISCCI